MQIVSYYGIEHVFAAGDDVSSLQREVVAFLDFIGVNLPQQVDDDVKIDDLFPHDYSLRDLDSLLERLFPDCGLEGDMKILNAIHLLVRHHPKWPIRQVH